MLTTGRRLDAQGAPMPGTGFDFDPEGRLGSLIAERTSPLYSDPTAGEWAFTVRSPDEGGSTVTRNIHVFRPGYPGPLEHIHPTYAEHFEIVQGVIRFTVDGKEQDAHTGESREVPQQTRHVFRNPGDEFAAMIITIRPEGAFDRMIQAFFGMSHDGRLGDGKRPPFWDAMAVLDAFPEDIVYTAPALRIARFLAKALAPVTRRLGHIADETRYHDPAFWAARVEQPEPA